LARKLLNVRPPQKLKLIEITPLIPFSAATGDFTQNPEFPTALLCASPATHPGVPELC
jgi:hypothetical protein